MHVAIIGAGFSGLAAAWHALQQLSIKVKVFDPAGIGGGASGVSAGLLHSYVGAHAKPNRDGKEGYRETIRLLGVAAEAMGQPVADPTGFLRIALTDDQVKNFSLCAQQNEDVDWCSPEHCQELVPGVSSRGGIFIRSAISVNPTSYLEGLWIACERLGATLEKKTIASLQELDRFDAVIIATGASCRMYPELAHLPVTPVKGQILEMEFPKGLDHPKYPFSSQAYLILNPERHTFIAGATYERNFASPDPDVNYAKQDLLPKISELMPSLKEAAIVDCRAGIRASTPSHFPILTRINERCWVITGMGSKGLLYHALYAEKLVADVVSSLF